MVVERSDRDGLNRSIGPSESGSHPIGPFEIVGFSLANASNGDTVPVLARAAMTSDHPDFHRYVRGFAEHLGSLSEDGRYFRLVEGARRFAIVVAADGQATLRIDDFDIALRVIVKRDVGHGEPVTLDDIGDIVGAGLPDLQLDGASRVVICVRSGWKFLLVFDLAPEGPPQIAWIETMVAMGMRRLLFERLYRSIEDDDALSKLVASGWFPFNTLKASEQERLQQANRSDFRFEEIEAEVVGSFDGERIGHLTDRWWRHHAYADRREQLEEGTALFLEGRYIPAITTLIVQIEGILRTVHVPEDVGRQGMEKVLKTAFTAAANSLGEDSLYLPTQFVHYLRQSIFAPFDPVLSTNGATRNSVVHGRASSEAYTGQRALQIILTLDQIAWFLSLPRRGDEQLEADIVSS